MLWCLYFGYCAGRSVRKVVLRNFCNYIKRETLAHVFSCEFCEISKSTFSTEQVLATTSADGGNCCKETHNQQKQQYFKRGVLKNFAIFTETRVLESLFNKVEGLFTGKHVLESLFNKVAGLKGYNFIKKGLQHRCFPANIAKSLRTAFFMETLWLLRNQPKLQQQQQNLLVNFWNFIKYTKGFFFRELLTLVRFLKPEV